MNGDPRLFREREQLSQALVSGTLGNHDLFKFLTSCAQSFQHGYQTKH
jgi:hypothetical protein